MINNEINKLAKTLKDSWERPDENVNIQKSERIVSVAAGAFIFVKGITNLFSHPVIALGEVAIGGGLLYRGITGYCPVKDVQDQNEPLLTDTITITEQYLTKEPV